MNYLLLHMKDYNSEIKSDHWKTKKSFFKKNKIRKF